MIQLNAPSIPSADLETKTYSQFKGVDFSVNDTMVAETRSPEALNLIADAGGYPEKRPGWRYLHTTSDTINQLMNVVFADGYACMLAHIGTKLFTWDDITAPSEVLTGFKNHKSVSFSHRGALYILDGGNYWKITHEGSTFTKTAVADEAYVPTVQINITGETLTQSGNEYIGGHTYVDYESPNVLTLKRKCTMCGDGTSKLFFLPEEDIDSVDLVTIAGVATTAYTTDLKKGRIRFTTAPAVASEGAGYANIEVTYQAHPTERFDRTFTGDGSTTEYQLDEGSVSVHVCTVNGTEKTEGTDYTFDSTTHKVTFTSAPANGALIKVTFVGQNADELIDRIKQCSLCETYGYYNDNRFFLSGVLDGNGDPDTAFWNIDYMSGTDDPSYFPYEGYTRIGSDTARIMGYLKQYDSLIYVKADNEQDAQIFVRTASETDDGVIFPVKQGIQGVGAVATGAITNLRDTPLFLAKEGVYAITGTSVKDHLNTQNVSKMVDARLTKEENLSEAQATFFGSFWMCCVGSHVYVADARQQSAPGDGTVSGFEWYYWDGFHVTQWFPCGPSLYFASRKKQTKKWFGDGTKTTFSWEEWGCMSVDAIKVNGSQVSWLTVTLDVANKRFTLTTAPGNGVSVEMEYSTIGICKVNYDIDRIQKYSDGSYETDGVEGSAIKAIWTTRADTLGTFTVTKNIPKKGCAVMVKPYTHTSIHIGYVTNREGEISITGDNPKHIDLFDFSDIDFTRLSFSTMDMPKVIPLNRKIKKFNIIQIVVKSEEVNEGFGVYGIQLTYMYGRYVK